MLSKERTKEIMEQFSQECYDYWRKEGCGHFESFINMLKDLDRMGARDPFSPEGELLDIETKAEFIEKEKNR